MAIRFEINVPQVLTFPYGDFKQIDRQYGRQYMYTVASNTGLDRLFADPALHEVLQAAGMEPGRILQITKRVGTDKEWEAKAEEVREEDAVPLPEEEPVGVANGHEQIEAAVPAKRAKQPDFAALEHLMQHCLRSSWIAWERIRDLQTYSSEDVRAVGITLFLECARKGIRPGLEEKPLEVAA